MPFIIDAHEDLAYNALTFGRNYLHSAAETRRAEQETLTPQRNGQTLLGWADYQRGQVAAIFATLFAAPRRYSAGEWESQIFASPVDARKIYETQLDFYLRLTDEHPDQFRLVRGRKDLAEVLAPWEKTPAYLPVPVKSDEAREADERPVVTHPVGLLILMEGAEGLRAPEEMEEWYEKGVCMAGPVWAGTRFCGGTLEPGDFTREGYVLLDVMAGLGMTLDISHMNEVSALQALDRYPGSLIASHANARALLKGAKNERHLTDTVIHRLIERNGVIGVLPFNGFLKQDWSPSDDHQSISLRTLVAHIDHICQLAGDARHVALGTDFDGGFGWPAVPHEINTIADMQKLVPLLGEYGYSDESIAGILGKNWQAHLERTLPA